MQNGMKAGTAIVVAFMLTGFAGFLTAVSPETVERTTYDRVTDLTPVVSATEVSSYDKYLPATNVTGWSEAVIIPTTDTASPYISKIQDNTIYETATMMVMTPSPLRSTDLNTNVSFWNLFGNPMYVYTYTDNGNIGKITNSLSSTDIASGRQYNGGYSLDFSNVGGYSYYSSVANNITVDGESKLEQTRYMDGSHPWYFMPLSTFYNDNIELLTGENQFSTPKNTTTITFLNQGVMDSAGSFYHITSGPTWSWTGGTGGIDHLLDSTSRATCTTAFEKIEGSHEGNVQYLTYSEDNQLWFPTKIDSMGYPMYEADRTKAGYSSDEVYLVFDGYQKSYASDGFSLKATTGDFSYKYIDATKFVTIGGDLAFTNNSDQTFSTRDRPYTSAVSTLQTALEYDPLYVTVGATVQITYTNTGGGFLNFARTGDSIGIATNIASNTAIIYGTITTAGECNVTLSRISPPSTNVEEIGTVHMIAVDDYDEIGHWTNTSLDNYNNSTVYQNGFVSFITEPGTTISSDDAYWSNISGGADVQGDFTFTVPSDIPYDLVLVTLDFINESFYAQGISYPQGVQTPDTANYILGEYKYEISFPTRHLNNNPLVGQPTSSNPSSPSKPYTAVTSIPSLIDGYTVYVDVGTRVSISSMFTNDCELEGDSIGLYGREYTSATSWGGLFGTVTSTGTCTVTFIQDSNNYSFTIIAVESINPQYPSYITSLDFYKSGGTRGFVVETWVQLDPQKLLWGDPYLYMSYWYPDMFVESDGNVMPKNDTGLRVLFNGFVAYGNTITINGQVMSVMDGRVFFDYYVTTISGSDEDSTVTTETKSGNALMKGMAVDMYGGHVYLVSTEEKNATYDLGAYNQSTVTVIKNGETTSDTDRKAFTISGDGAWYWYANLYNIVIMQDTEMHIDLSKGINGWEMNLQVSALLFAGMLIVSVAGVSYFVRDTDPLSLLDWVIIGITLILVMGVASI